MQLKNSLKNKGIYTFQQIRNGEVIDEWTVDNIVPNEGLNYMLDAAFSNGTQLTTFFVGLFKNNYTPIATDTMATFPGSGVANESTTDYSQAARPTWSDSGASGQQIGNVATPAAFSFTATTTTLYGAFLTSSSVKGSTTGTLISAARFATSRVVLAGDILNVVYTLTSSSS